MLTKIIFPMIKEDNILKDKNVGILQRLQKLLKYNLLTYSIEGKKNIYYINTERVIFGKSSMIINRRKFAFDNVFMVKENGNWESFQLDA